MATTNTTRTISSEREAPERLSLWVCCHCETPRLAGSGCCKNCGAQLHNTGEYIRADTLTTTTSSSDTGGKEDYQHRAQF
jgi:hypothetical protein